MRIAYVVVADTAYMYGGVGTSLYTLGQYCDIRGWYLDIFADKPAESRKRFMPPEFYQSFSARQNNGYAIAVPVIPMGHMGAVQDPSMFFNAAYNFLTSFKHKVPDLVIFGDPLTALLCYSYRIHEYVPCYIYLHWHELLSEMKSTLFTAAQVDLYRSICRSMQGVGFLTQSAANVQLIKKFMQVQATVMPLSIQIRKGADDKAGIAYLGGGDVVKNPWLASEVLHLFHDTHPDVPLYVICGRGKDKLDDLFADIAIIHYRLPRDAMQEKLDSIKVGLHTSTVEGFGISVLEQISRYPVALHNADYCASFPTCPVFDTVQEGFKLLEKLYFDNVYYSQVRDDCMVYAKTHYSFDALGDSIAKLVKSYHKTHSVRDITIENIRKYLGSEAIPLHRFYKSIGWGSDIIGTQSLKACPDGVFEFVQGQAGTYIGLPGCTKGSQFLF